MIGKNLSIGLALAAVVAGGCANQGETQSGSADATVDTAEANEKAAEAANADNHLSAEERADKRQHLQTMAHETLLELAENDPDLLKELQEAAGYAVFDSSGYNLVLYVAGTGAGVAYDNDTNLPVYMNMIRVGTGPGIGYKEYRQLLVFTAESAYEQFVATGLDVGASADLGPLASGSMSFNPYVKTYTITDKGLDVQANWGGLLYVESLALNEDP